MCLRKKLSFSKKVVTGCTASSLVLDIVSASYFSHSNRRVVNSHRSFNLHFRNSWWWWTSAHVLTCHLCIFFGKVFVQLICSLFWFLFYWATIPSFFMCLVIFFFAMSHGMWDFSSLTRGLGIKPVPPAVEARSLNQWTTREVAHLFIFKLSH